jgi:uncharacterized lipoprotein YddW (UPF0748 family)
VNDQPSGERPKDWMEVWHETGDITWQKPLSPEVNARILKLYEELSHEPGEEPDDG